ncbi:MAG: TlpA disulfide reductase family protein [Pseudohongiellaceae bacterium]
MRISKHLKPLALASGLLLCAPAIAVEEGDQAPDFTLPSIYAERGEISLADYRGKAVYIDFWASWCAPCLVSLPQYNELYQKYREQGLEILAINVDNPVEEGLFFLEETPLDFPIPADPEGNALELFEVIGMPTSFLIGPDGNVELVHVGFREGDIAAIEEAIQRVLPSP